ncbi:MAG TPA: cell division protein FtsQ [Bordetella sp.]
MADLMLLPQLPATFASKAAAVGISVFLLAGLVSNVWLASTSDKPLLTSAATRERVLGGTVSHELADRMADSPLPFESARVQRGLNWLAFGDLGPRVRQGCPGWLFIRDELMVYRDASAHAATRAQTVAAVQRDLASRGIKLLVIIVPDKSRIEAQHLCGLHRPASLDGRVNDWMAQLAAQGVRAVDLAPALRGVQGDAYFHTDTHWTEAGAGAAAQAVAQRVHQLGLALPPGGAYKVEAQPVARRPGDLVHLAGLDWLPPSMQPEPETAQAHTYTPEAKAAATDDDLFGDAGLPIVSLLGTSYSRNSNFAPQLAMALGSGVNNFARDGGMFGGAAQAYFPSQAYTQTPPKLIVWEVDERDLQAPLLPADAVAVPLASPAAPGAAGGARASQ